MNSKLFSGWDLFELKLFGDIIWIVLNSHISDTALYVMSMSHEKPYSKCIAQNYWHTRFKDMIAQ